MLLAVEGTPNSRFRSSVTHSGMPLKQNFMLHMGKATVISFSGVQIMSWELLTKTKFYPADADMTTVVDTLKGNLPLASEQPLSAEVRHGLGNKTYRETVVAMLNRDPQLRPTVSELVHDWTSVFQQATITSGVMKSHV
jgi:serine/threonine protein kinase